MSPKKNKRLRLNPNRDLAILYFLWKWKVSTTKAIAARFFSNTHPRNAYLRLSELSKFGFIESRVDLTGHKFAWLLDDRGFEIISPNLPLLKEEGFRSEHIGHDLLSTAVLLGEFLKAKPSNIELISEQELRRIHESQLPTEITKRNSRRPDGYWCITNGNASRFIALEVEIAQKTESEYKSIGYAYNLATSVEQVVWVVKSGALALKIQSSFSKSSLEQRDIHSFILLADFQENGWAAKVVLGHKRHSTIFDILDLKRQELAVPGVVSRTVSAGVKSQCNAGVAGQFRNLLSLSRTYVDSETYAQYTMGDFS